MTALPDSEDIQRAVEAGARAVHAEDCCPLDANSPCVKDEIGIGMEMRDSRIVLASAWPHVEAYWRKKIADEIEAQPHDDAAPAGLHPGSWVAGVVFARLEAVARAARGEAGQ